MISWYQKKAPPGKGMLFLKFCKHLNFFFDNTYIIFNILQVLLMDLLYLRINVSNTRNRLDGTQCYKDNNFTLDNLPAFISTPCRLNGKYIMLHSKIRQDVKYTGPIVVPFPFAVVYGNMFYS